MRETERENERKRERKRHTEGMNLTLIHEKTGLK